jgi:hypothetical protein
MEGDSWFGATPRHTILFRTNFSGTNATDKMCRFCSGRLGQVSWPPNRPEQF